MNLQGIVLGLMAILGASALLSACASSPPPGAEVGPTLIFRTIVDAGENTRYAVILPRGYSKNARWPAIMFLHGSGECGTEGVRPTHVGLPPAALAHPERWPFVIIIPQKPTREMRWIDRRTNVLAVLDDALNNHSIDRSRLYLSGLSQGGAGTWDIAAAHPEMFAAIVPVCGFADAVGVAPSLIETPVWAFHGEKDDIVPPARTREIVAEIERLGGSPRATFFPDANHNSWDPAYATPDLPAWLLDHAR